MPKIKPMGLIESMSGKVCRHSDVYFFRRNGKVFTGKRCNPYKGDPSASQTAHRTLFGQIATAVKARKADPSKAAADAVAFANQSRYESMQAYLWHVCKEEIENA